MVDKPSKKATPVAKKAATKESATKTASKPIAEKTAPKTVAKKAAPKKSDSKSVLLAVADAEGDAPVQAYIAAMPGWQNKLGRRIDALIVKAVPGVRKAVKWRSPFYGVEGQGWFLTFHSMGDRVKVAFFRGASLNPIPPIETKQKEVRYLDIIENDKLDEKQFASWVKQASALPGWMK